jgi:hypothetical protein
MVKVDASPYSTDLQNTQQDKSTVGMGVLPLHCLFDACITGNEDAMGDPLPVFKGFMSTHHKRALADGVRP